MFKGLINDAKTAAASLVAKYLARVSVAVPFIAALGFATAAITLMLVERFGHIAAYWMIAGGFVAIGLVATLVVSVKEQEEEIAEKAAEQSDTAEVGTDAAAQAAVQLPIALLGAIFSSPVGPDTALGGIKMLGRNIPLVILLALIGMLFWPSKSGTDGDAAEVDPHKPNGMHPPAGADLRREAA
jgi:uncharacterized membrane protein